MQGLVYKIIKTVNTIYFFIIINLKNKNSTTRETKEVFFIQNAFINIFDSDLAVTERCGLTR